MTDQPDSVEETTPSTKTKSKKTSTPKPPKPPSKEKLLERAVRNVFARDTARRQSYVYVGLAPEPTTYLVGNAIDTVPKDLLYADPNQTLGLIRITDPREDALVQEWLRAMSYPKDPAVFLINNAITACNHVKWDISKLRFSHPSPGAVIAHTPDIEAESGITQGQEFEIVRPYLSVFSMNFLMKSAEYLLPMLNDDPICFAYPFSSEDVITRLHITHDKFADTHVGRHFRSDIHFPLARGVDMYDTRGLVKDKTEYTIDTVFKIASGCTLVYGVKLITPIYRSVITRCYLYMVPQPKRVGHAI